MSRDQEKNRRRAILTAFKALKAGQVVIGGAIVVSFFPLVILIPLLMLKNAPEVNDAEQEAHPTRPRTR